MLYKEIIAVCSQIRTKHLNTLCGQNMWPLVFTRVNLLFPKIFLFYLSFFLSFFACSFVLLFCESLSFVIQVY